MNKTLKEMQIEVARYWSGVEEMKDCYWELLTDGKSVKPAEVRLSNIDFESLGPYLQIEDGNPWSSAAILARSGCFVYWDVDYEVGRTWILANNKLPGLGFFSIDLETGNLQYPELAYNFALQWLHKNAPEVWAKGMEGLQ